MMAVSNLRSLVMKPVFVIVSVLLLPWAVGAQTAVPVTKPGVNKSANYKSASKKAVDKKKTQPKTRASRQADPLSRPQWVQPAAAVHTPLPMGVDELAIAERVHLGRLPCELGASVRLESRRLADECAHPEQMAFAENMKTNPPPVLFDTTGMGRPND
jgi:hypothetical protein